MAGAGGGASASGAGAGGDRGGAGRGADTGQGTGGTAAGQGGSHVTINLTMGHVFGTSGMAEVASMLSDAVVNSGVTLTASNTTTGVQLTR